ncbi:MAG: hypothetical protein UCJ13_02790, partial [Bacteroidaceae bacterium]|nr:hypothetical protein [Bacteroidaceae bacterium]
PKVVREVIDDIGYNNAEYGFDAKTCAVLSAIDEQSGDIAMGVNDALEHKEGFVLDVRHIRVITRAQMEAEGGSTGIGDIVTSDKVQNGKLQGIFNLSGQRVSKPTKGLYIINGKKVLVK